MSTYIFRLSKEMSRVVQVDADSRHEAQMKAIDWFTENVNDADVIEELDLLAEDMEAFGTNPDVILE